jgi:hypothetical protein
MKKLTPGLQKALNKKTKGTAAKTETRVTVSVTRYRSTGDYKLLLSTGLRLLHSVALLEYEAKEIAGKLGIEIEQRPPYAGGL